jgi:thioredoxin 1
LIGILLAGISAMGCAEYAGKGRQNEGKKEITEVKHIMNAEEFQVEVMDYDGYVLLDIGAHWCGPCRKLGPHINRLAVEMEGELKVVKLYEDDKGADNQAAYKKYVGRGIPTLVIFKSGEVIAKTEGSRDYNGLKAWVEENI